MKGTLLLCEQPRHPHRAERIKAKKTTGILNLLISTWEGQALPDKAGEIIESLQEGTASDFLGAKTNTRPVYALEKRQLFAQMRERAA